MALSGGFDFTVVPATFYETVYGTGLVIQSLPNGTPLVIGADYFVRIIARDTDGSAAASD